jgi:hypothetical protein
MRVFLRRILNAVFYDTKARKFTIVVEIAF